MSPSSPLTDMIDLVDEVRSRQCIGRDRASGWFVLGMAKMPRNLPHGQITPSASLSLAVKTARMTPNGHLDLTGTKKAPIALAHVVALVSYRPTSFANGPATE
jgi:hypothetical protein